MIRAIVFDYSGVIKINEKNLVDEIANYLKINKEDFDREYFSMNHLFNLEHKNFEDVILLVLSKFTDSEEAKNYILDLMEENNRAFKLNDELIDIIKNLKSQNYKIGLLSNNSLKLRQDLIEDGILDLFDEIVISSEVGYQKPQIGIFEILFSKLNTKANEVVFIDDSPKSLENSEVIGYTPILFKDNQTLKSDLAKILNI